MTDPVSVNWLALLVIPAALLVVNVVLTALVSVLIWQAKDFRTWIRKKFTDVDARIEKVRDDLHAFKELVPERYIPRDDFGRQIEQIRGDVVGVMTSVDRKLDAIGRAMTPERGP